MDTKATKGRPVGANKAASRSYKSDWAGVGVADAFKADLPYPERLRAQRLFHQALERLMSQVVDLAEREVEAAAAQPRRFLTRPQISPGYTRHPAAFGAWAAIGMSAFREYARRMKDLTLSSYIHEFLADPAGYDKLPVDAEAYRKLARLVAGAVQKRIFLEGLKRLPEPGSIETYRLYMASICPFPPLSLADSLDAVVLYGDVMPSPDAPAVPELIKALLERIWLLSRPFVRRLADVADDEGAVEKLRRLGVQWLRELSLSLSDLLQAVRPSDEWTDDASTYNPDSTLRPYGEKGRISSDASPGSKGVGVTCLAGGIPLESDENARLRSRPSSDRPSDDGPALQTDPSPADDDEDMLERLAQSLKNAGAPVAATDDLRWDLVEAKLRAEPYQDGPLAGSPSSGHEVRVRLGENLAERGDLFTRALRISDDEAARRKLLDEIEPLARMLKRNLYPNLEEKPKVQRYRTSGMLDGQRLVQAEFSDAVFKRYRIVKRPDPRGRPLLLLACDASASLNRSRMKLLRRLAGGWILGSARTSMQLIAATYRSGKIRPGLKAPLVEWIHHPQHTPAVSRVEAVQALNALPPAGSGRQADALSIAYLLAEARHLARGNRIYFILLSDCAWNRCFETSLSGRQEVHGLLRHLAGEFGDDLHSTLVALGVDWETGMEDVMDRVMCIGNEDLEDPGVVAHRIGAYVADCIREREAPFGDFS